MDGYKEKALENLIKLSERQGYLTIDNVIDSSDDFELQIQDIDWISNAITTRSILIYDEEPLGKRLEDNTEYSDYSHVDYERIFEQVLELNGSLKMFIDEIRGIIPPQYREITQLKYQVREGNSHARQRMIEMHLRMAVKIAFQRAVVYDMDIEDAISCACIGLINAVDKYNPDSFGAFASYAALWMQQILGRESPTQRPLVYYPVHKKEGYYIIYPIIKNMGCLQCSDIGECSKIIQIVTDKLGCTNDQAKDIIEACIPFESIEMFLENTNGNEKHGIESNGNVVLPECLISREALFKILSDTELKERIQRLLDDLKERERDVITLRYGLDGRKEKTLEEVGSIFGVTRERIRQIEVKALSKLQNPLRSKILIDFYE